MEDRIASHVDILINAQLTLARGTSYLLCSTTGKDGKRSRDRQGVKRDAARRPWPRCPES